jgi:membrane protein implicated in regulation of membrane protease activity
MELFAFLDGAAPWWWIAFALALGLMEMATFTYFLIWPALAAFVVGLLLVISPEMAGKTQLTWFAALALAFSVAGYFAVKRFRPEPAETPSLNRRSERLVGRTGVALDDFQHGEGVIVIDDTRWKATLPEGAAAKGARLKVTGADGMKLICAAL